ncbi:MAG: RluA family pseudouridine synthase [Verrucomicrobiota bacterium]
MSIDRPVHQFEVPAHGERVRLDQFLCSVLPERSRSQLQEWVRKGAVLVDGKVPSKPGERLKGGESVLVTEPEPAPIEAQAEDIPIEVLYEDEELLVINKAAGMVVHPAAGNWTGTVVNALLHHCDDLSEGGGQERPGIVHRLDKETSGCLVVAKSDFAHKHLSAQFAGREVRKIYLALALGPFRQESGTVNAPIGRHPVQRQKMAVLPPGKGRESRTDWRVLGELEFKGTLVTMVQCRLHSGRTHQIRVHMAHIGHGLLGDAVYGRRAGAERQMLHAWQLGFFHPRSGEWKQFTCPLPADFQAAGVTFTSPAE